MSTLGKLVTSWWFWYGYFRLVTVLSIILHVVLFERELDKRYPSIPYEQEFP